MPEQALPPALPATSPPPAGSSLLTAGGVVLAIGGLYFGREIFIPFALAILLGFALTPLVNWLRRLKLPRIAAVILAVALAFAVIGGIAFVVGSQLVQLANNLPSYQTTISEKIRSLQSSSPGGGVVERVTTTIQDLGKELSGEDKPPAPATARPGAEPPRREPVTVRLEQPDAKPLQVLQSIVGPLLAPLATAGIVVVFLIFVLLEREDLRDRFIKLAGAGDLHKSTQALNDAAGRVSRYLLMQLVVNLTYGIPIGIGLYFIGVPNAVLWGLLAAVLRFVPYLGPFLAALFPLALAFAVDPSWSMLLWVAGLFLVAEIVSNNVIEPWLYGSSTGLSSLAIIIAAVFWTTLWGPVGLFLSTPLTVCLVVIGRYVPHLEFLGVLLGNDPVLAPEERFYQRLLAGNLEEAVEMAEDHVDEHSVEAFYEGIALPALRLAENDRQRSTTDVTYRRVVAETAVCVVREIADHLQEGAERSKKGKDAEPAEPSDPPAIRVLCIAGRTELDRSAAEMLAQTLVLRRVGARVMSPIAVSQDTLGQLELQGIEVVCLSYLHPQPQVFARYVCRRLKRRAPNLKLLICLWNPPPQGGHSRDLAGHMSADTVVVTLTGAIQQIDAWVAQPLKAPMQSPPTPENEQERLQALRDLGVGAARGGYFDETTRRVADAFDTPIALVSFIEEEHQIWSGATGLSPDLDALRRTSREVSVCGHVVAIDEVLVIEDVTNDPRFAENPLLLEKGIRFYAGAPLRNAAGLVLGALCVIDTKPRTFSNEDQHKLQAMADELMARVELERSQARNNTTG